MPRYRISNCNKKDEISVENDCLFWWHKTIIPYKFKNKLLNELHACHAGMVKMKALSRSYFWWPGIDQDIENKVKDCEACNFYKNTPPKSELVTWAWPEKPWSKIHLDYFTIFNKNF